MKSKNDKDSETQMGTTTTKKSTQSKLNKRAD